MIDRYTPGESNFLSDTTRDFAVNGVYQFRITSVDGSVPVMTLGNQNFRVELASQQGSDYFFKIYVQAAPGAVCPVYVNGVYLLTAAVGQSAAGV